MKIRNLLILGLVLLGFTYCSSNEVLDGPTTGDDTAGTLKMEIAVTMPTTRSSTNEDGGSTGGSEAGTANENAAKSIQVLIVKKTEVAKTYTYESSETSGTPGSSFFTTAEFRMDDMKVGDQFYVYAFVNPYKDLETDLNAAFTNSTSHVDAINAVIGASKDNFFMSNATVVTSAPLKAEHISGAPLKVAVDVQRAVARMEYDSGKLTAATTDGIGVGGDADAVKVKFTHYKLVNTSRSFYNLKRVSADGSVPTVDPTFPTAVTSGVGGKETASNFVVDTDWAAKKDAADFWAGGMGPARPWQDGFFNTIGSAETIDKGAHYVELGAKAYTTENTTPKTLAGDKLTSRKGLATAVVFKGYLAVDAPTTGEVTLASGHKYNPTETSPVYVYNNKYVGSFDKLPTAIQNIVTAGITDKATPITDERIKHNNKDLAAAGVTGYSYDAEYKVSDSKTGAYPVYYVYYNRHNHVTTAKDGDKTDGNTTDPMEFAVVRNNIYKLAITGISKFGHPNDPELTPSYPNYNPDPTPQDPKDPIESSTLYMQVTATVLDWTVRTNNIEF